jgi:hypothetical protein
VNTKKLCQLFNAIYDSGSIPADWLIFTLALIPKKLNVKTCEEYRFISIHHAPWLHEPCIQSLFKDKKIYDKCEEKSDS